MKAALDRSEQAVGTCLRVHVPSWAMWLQLFLPWRKGKVRGQAGKKKCAIFFSAFGEALGQSRQTQIGSQLPCMVTVSARSFAPLLSSAGLWAFHSVAQVITCCYLAILLIKSNFFCLLYDFWMLFIRRRWLEFLSLFTCGWWWASYCKGKNCQLWTRSILLCLCFCITSHNPTLVLPLRISSISSGELLLEKKSPNHKKTEEIFVLKEIWNQ